MSNFEVIEAGGGRHIKAWKQGVYFEQEAIQQLIACAQLSVVHPYVAAMPDCHKGYGSTVGSVIPTKDAVIPSAVGVDIGCGMYYRRLDIQRAALPEDLSQVRAALEQAVPSGGPGEVGSWGEHVPAKIRSCWMTNFSAEYDKMGAKHPEAISPFAMKQLGTLGTGNHFVELTTESQSGRVGILIHSGSRGLGNRIGTYFSRVARHWCEARHIHLPDRDLAYLPCTEPEFMDYVNAVFLAQSYAWHNRRQMMENAQIILSGFASVPLLYNNDPFEVHCHHNYITTEEYNGEKLFVTRKGAVRAGKDELGIIPGSMGARTYIVRGLGSQDSFQSCSHGAGRLMSRTKAKATFTIEDHIKATEGVECDKTSAVLDETPLAYKDIEDVMRAQTDLVEPVFHMKQFLCVKGLEGSENRKWNKKKKKAAANGDVA